MPVPTGSQVLKWPAEPNEHKDRGCGHLEDGQISESTAFSSEYQKCITAWRPVSTHLPAHHLPLASSLPAPEEAESPGLRARSSPRSRTKTPPHFPKEGKPCPRAGNQWRESPWSPKEPAWCPPLCPAPTGPGTFPDNHLACEICPKKPQAQGEVTGNDRPRFQYARHSPAGHPACQRALRTAPSTLGHGAPPPSGLASSNGSIWQLRGSQTAVGPGFPLTIWLTRASCQNCHASTFLSVKQA